MEYAQHFTPLESDPGIFSQLAAELGLSPSLAFVDIPSLEPEFLPSPALAAILLFPTAEDYETCRIKDNSSEPQGIRDEGEGQVVWYHQTINNACGLYATLHALSNGPARGYLEPLSFMGKLLHMSDEERTRELETSDELKHVYQRAAQRGSSRPPDDPQEEVDYHFVCLVTSNGRLHELDGDRTGPVDRGAVSDGDGALGETGLRVIRERLEAGEANLGFSLMALVHRVE
ncbi:ubiquitinyl hydrolase 1 [Thelonectria olida]|uniref:Ubiquitin carboxyl-terminal hydrolase n=1 Tax=Thelonectria olida TaxID=1576542 RepID=A0A9P8VU06_9HYPO|nr:ubiquitinyl hydrolase 1 [Thelonectria olida]